jgi:hypothetical protein
MGDTVKRVNPNNYIRDDVIADLIKSCERHEKKHGSRKMSLEDLRKICRLN